MPTPPLFIPECHVDTVLTRTLLLYRYDFDDFINHQHGVSKVANEMQRQWRMFGDSRHVVGIVDHDKKLHEVAYLADFEVLPQVRPVAGGPHSIRRHPARPTQHLIVLNPACDTWIWEAATAAGLSPLAAGLPADFRAFLDYCKTKGIENDPPLVALLAGIRRARPAVYAELGDFVAGIMGPRPLLL